MNRLDKELVLRGLLPSRSQAENMIELGYIKVDGVKAKKASLLVHPSSTIEVDSSNQYVSRAALKLKSVANKLNLDFSDRTLLDVGSSTGGFTEYALKQGVKKVIAVDVGTNQLHPSLRADKRIELHEQTDVRDLTRSHLKEVDMVVIDVSFISLREILPSLKRLLSLDAEVIAMVKPQFEAGAKLKTRGVIKNDSMRRAVLKDFERWVKKEWVIINKADSEISGKKGNTERFYLIKKTV